MGREEEHSVATDLLCSPLPDNQRKTMLRRLSSFPSPPAGPSSDLPFICPGTTGSLSRVQEAQLGSQLQGEVPGE